MIARLAFAALVAAFLAQDLHAVQSKKEDPVKKMLAELEAIKQRLDAIEQRLQGMEKRLDSVEKESRKPDMPSFPGFHPPSDPASYDDLKLPPDPTEDQAREYVLAIKARVMGKTAWGTLDPEPQMLAQVGPRHVKVLLDALEDGIPGCFNGYAIEALKRIAADEHRDLVIARLAQFPDLVKIVFEKGWARDARKVLVGQLTADSRLPVEWIQAVVSLNDPKTWSALVSHLRYTAMPYQVYKEICKISGLPRAELNSVVAEIWERAKGKPEIEWYMVDGVARIAAGHGHVDALAWIVGKLDAAAGSNVDVHESLRGYVLSLIPFRGPDDEIEKWFEENRSKLSFDPEKRKYILSKGK